MKVESENSEERSFAEELSSERYARTLRVCRTIVSSCVDLHILGGENITQDGPVIVSSNHLSAWDIPILGVAIDQCSERPTAFIAKKELVNVPLFGSYMQNGHGAVIADREQFGRSSYLDMRQVLDEDQLLLAFAEGSRKKQDPRVNSQLKQGVARLALETSSEIVPTAISYRKGKSFKKQALVMFGLPITAAEQLLFTARDKSKKDKSKYLSDILAVEMQRCLDAVNDLPDWKNLDTSTVL